MDDERNADQVIRRRLPVGRPALRASDAEREDALHALAAHFADGRLERSEFDERVETALAARTRPELAALFADLPDPKPTAAAPPAGPAPARTGPRPERRPVPAPAVPALLAPIVLALAVLALAVLAVLHGFFPFPLIPLLFILSRRRRHWHREAHPWT